MKKILLFVMMVMMSTAILAQKKAKDPVKMANRQSAKMKQVLSLNDEQFSSVRGINERYAGQLVQKRNESSLPGGSRKKEMKALRESRTAEINSILTPDQKEKWTAYKTEKKTAKKERRDHRKTKRENLKSELSLSDAQMMELEKVNREFKARHRALKQDRNNSSEQSKKERMALKAEHEAQVNKILLPEQLAKYKQLRSERKHHHKRRKK